MSLNVSPDIETRLITLAQTMGISVEDFLRRVVEEKSEFENVDLPVLLSPAERAAAWRESVKGLPTTFPLSDEAISRESIYSERG